MKVSIKSYNDRWVSYVHDRYMDKNKRDKLLKEGKNG